MVTTTTSHSPYLAKVRTVASHWQGSGDALKALKEYVVELSEPVSVPQNSAEIAVVLDELDKLIASAEALPKDA